MTENTSTSTENQADAQLQQQQQAQRNVTLEDVRAALGSTDPNLTNAGALREIIGHGSNKTVQKHLEFIRAEGTAKVLDLAGAAPDAPKDLIAAVWSHAWSTAQAKTAGALASAQALQTKTEATLAVAKADAVAALERADKAEQTLEKVQQDAKQQMQQDKDAHAAALTAAQKNAETTQAEQEKEISRLKQELINAEQAAAMNAAKHDAAIVALNSQVDRLVNQLADLRAGFGRFQINEAKPSAE